MVEEKIYWLVNSEENRRYDVSTWYRSVGIEKFVKKVEKENEIVGVTFQGNNIGFILKKLQAEREKEKASRIEAIRLRDGKGIEVVVDWNAKKRCECGAEIWFAKTKNNSLIPIELITKKLEGDPAVAKSYWDTHFATCPLASKFRKKKK